MTQSLPELRAAEAEVAREWHWLHDALNEIARVRVEHGDPHAFRLMQAQAMVMGQRRIELSMRIAELERGRLRRIEPIAEEQVLCHTRMDLPAAG
jgi:hypothetical protein